MYLSLANEVDVIVDEMSRQTKMAVSPDEFPRRIAIVAMYFVVKKKLHRVFLHSAGLDICKDGKQKGKI